MTPLEGIEPAQPDCNCALCDRIRSHSEPAEFELSDTMPAKTPAMTLEELRERLKAVLE
jgi:hypothetical protein